MAGLLTLIGLLFPFILQQTFYPFFRFGMFAEPVRRTIQSEQFFLASLHEDGKYNLNIAEATNIQKSNLDYLLRNYYYRKEADRFLEKLSPLFPISQLPDTLFMLRKLNSDTTVVARYPKK